MSLKDAYFGTVKVRAGTFVSDSHTVTGQATLWIILAQMEVILFTRITFQPLNISLKRKVEKQTK